MRTRKKDRGISNVSNIFLDYSFSFLDEIERFEANFLFSIITIMLLHEYEMNYLLINLTQASNYQTRTSTRRRGEEKRRERERERERRKNAMRSPTRGNTRFLSIRASTDVGAVRDTGQNWLVFYFKCQTSSRNLRSVRDVSRPSGKRRKKGRNKERNRRVSLHVA